MGNSNEKDERLETVSLQDQAAAEAAYKDKGLEGLLTHLKASVSQWKTIPIDIAVIGGPGSGKSTFINSIRGLNADDADTAAVGCIETTMGPMPYEHPQNPMLKFWDLPGVGTLNFPRDTYLEAIDFDKYVCFIFITATRFTENDAWLANEVFKTSRKAYFVRTKFHNDVTNDKEAHPRTHNSVTLLSQVRNDTRSHLQRMKSGAPVYVIDSHRIGQYDFQFLLNTLIRELPDLKKQEAVAMTLMVLSKDMVENKIKNLYRKTWMAALLALSSMSLPGVIIPNPEAMFAEVQLYYRLMGLDDASLQCTADISGVDFAKLRDAVDVHFPSQWLCSIGSLTKALTCAQLPIAAAAIGAQFSGIIPAVAVVVSSLASYGAQVAALRWAIKTMEKAALAVVHVITDETYNKL